MNASQVVAWLTCLLVAFFAAILAVHGSVKVAVLEKRFAEISETAVEQTAVLTDIRDLLGQIAGKPGAE